MRNGRTRSTPSHIVSWFLPKRIPFGSCPHSRAPIFYGFLSKGMSQNETTRNRTAGFSPWFHSSGFHYGYPFLTHSRMTLETPSPRVSFKGNPFSESCSTEHQQVLGEFGDSCLPITSMFGFLPCPAYRSVRCGSPPTAVPFEHTAGIKH